jgi:glycosyltransferase involved in cell wall biosynthesis
MNAGIRAARGELVARLDSDDVWFPEMLACQSSLLDARPEVGAVYAKATGMDAEGNPLPTTWGFPPRYPDSTLRSMLYEDMTCNITVVARRSCLERVGGFDESLRTSEDWDLWLRVSRHFEFAFLDLVVARFRLHSDSITACNAPGGDEERERRILVLDKFFALPGLPADALAMKRIAYRNVYTRNGLLWLTERKYRRAATAFVQAVRVSPARSAALGRVLWFVLKWRLLSRSAFGRSLADTAAWLQGSALIRNPPVERS